MTPREREMKKERQLQAIEDKLDVILQLLDAKLLPKGKKK